MSSKDGYVVEKNVEKFIHDGYTNFLDAALCQKVKSRIKHLKYKEYYPYEKSERVILYRDRKPKIRFMEIISLEPLKHSEIMGSLYGINVDMDLIGDIVIYNKHYYIIVTNKVYNFILNEFNMVGNKNISLHEVSNLVLNDYVRKYELKELVVPSFRIDNVVSKLINVSRDNLKNKFSDGEVIVNYEICYRRSYILREGDIFSIRRHGKYKFGNVLKNTKKDNYVIRIYRYIDN